MTKMKSFMTFLCIAPSFLWGRIQFYVGVHGDFRNLKHTLTMGNHGWNEVLVEAYKNDLTKLSESWLNRQDNTSGDQLLPSWMTQGTPLKHFKDLLDDKTSEIWKKRTTTFDIRLTGGGFFFRHEKVLMALEGFFGRSVMSANEKTSLEVFEASAPQELVEAWKAGKFVEEYSKESSSLGGGSSGGTKVVRYNTYDTQSTRLNPYSNSTLPYIYVYNENKISVQHDIKISSTAFLGSDLRLGSVLKDRLYLYGMVGVQGEWFSLDAKGRLPQGLPSLSLFYCCNAYSSPGDSAVFGHETISSSGATIQEKIFKKTKFKLGVFGGAGIEFYATHRVSLRADVTYTYFPDVQFQATDGAALIKYTHRPWKVGLGAFWRF